MKFTDAGLVGARVIDPDRLEDARGFFARVWCSREFEEQGLSPRLVQCSISFNHTRHTLRGMHYQVAPHEEAKLIRCTMGAVFDVIVDLRPQSPTYREWFGLELSAENRKMLYVPEGFAHGFLTLEDNTEVFYQMTEFFALGCGRGFRWNDPAFSISWPAQVSMIHDRDRCFPDFIDP